MAATAARGGDIIFQADDNLSTLMDFRYKRKYTAAAGENGRGARQKGRDAEDLVIRVAARHRAERGRNRPGHRRSFGGMNPLSSPKGGRGGWGNARFATPTRQIPRFAKPGLPGEDLHVTA